LECRWAGTAVRGRYVPAGTSPTFAPIRSSSELHETTKASAPFTWSSCPKPRYCAGENNRITLTGTPAKIVSSIAARPSPVPRISIDRLGRPPRPWLGGEHLLTRASLGCLPDRGPSPHVPLLRAYRRYSLVLIVRTIRSIRV
jgi:hypothetical protein